MVKILGLMIFFTGGWYNVILTRLLITEYILNLLANIVTAYVLMTSKSLPHNPINPYLIIFSMLIQHFIEAVQAPAPVVIHCCWPHNMPASLYVFLDEAWNERHLAFASSRVSSGNRQNCSQSKGLIHSLIQSGSWIQEAAGIRSCASLPDQDLIFLFST